MCGHLRDVVLENVGRLDERLGCRYVEHWLIIEPHLSAFTTRWYGTVLSYQTHGTRSCRARQCCCYPCRQHHLGLSQI